MASALDLAIKITGKDAGGTSALRGITKESQAATGKLKDLGTTAGKTQQHITRIAGTKPFTGLIAQANKLDSALKNVSNAMDEASSKGEGLRSFGGKMAIAGGGALLLANHLRQVSEEGKGVEKRLESILKSQGRVADMASINDAVNDVAVKGHFADDDEIRDAAIHLASFGAETRAINELLPRVARQVRTGFGSFESVADGMGKAIANFDLGPLAKSGLLFSDQEKAAVEAAKAIGGVAGQLKIVGVLTSAVDRNTVSLEDSLTATEAAANDAKRTLDDMMTNAGAGAAVADGKVKGLAMQVLQLGNNSKEAQEGAGAILQYGAYATTAAGGVVTLIGQVMQYKAAMALGSIAQAQSAATAAANTAAQTAQAGAITLTGNAAAASAAKLGLLARAQAVAASPLGKLGIGAAAVGATVYAGSEVAPGIENAKTMSDAELQKQSALGKFHEWGGRKLGGGKLGQWMEGLSDGGAGDAAEQKTFEMENAARARRGEGVLSFSQWKAGGAHSMRKAVAMPTSPLALSTQTKSTAGTVANPALPSQPVISAAANVARSANVQALAATPAPAQPRKATAQRAALMDIYKHQSDWSGYEAMRSGYDRHGNATSSGRNASGGQRLAVNADIGWDQTALANGDIQLTLRSEPVVIKQASLTGRF